MKSTNPDSNLAPQAPTFRIVAASLAALAVGLGAFGAHALKEQLASAGMTGVWEKAHLYHIIHALALFAVASTRHFKLGPGVLFVVGIFLFSGSLYGLAITDWKWLGPITPLGGTAFIVAWIWLAASTKK